MRQLARTLCRALSQSPNFLSELNVGGATPRHFTTASGLCAPTHIQDEPYCRQRQLLVLGNRVPQVSPDVWVAPNALLIGDVDLYDMVCISLLNVRDCVKIFLHLALCDLPLDGCSKVQHACITNLLVLPPLTDVLIRATSPIIFRTVSCASALHLALSLFSASSVFLPDQLFL